MTTLKKVTVPAVYWFSGNWITAFGRLVAIRDQATRSLRCRDSGLAVQRGLARSWAFFLPPFAGRLALAIPRGAEGLLAAVAFGRGGDLAAGTGPAHRVVLRDRARHDPAGIFQRPRRRGADTV